MTLLNYFCNLVVSFDLAKENPSWTTSILTIKTDKVVQTKHKHILQRVPDKCLIDE
jgi:hypothetical protein